MLILADFSYFHPSEELAQLLTNLGTSSCWAAITTAVNGLHLKKGFMQSWERDTLEKEIIKIALNNRLVSAIALSGKQLCNFIHRFETLD